MDGQKNWPAWYSSPDGKQTQIFDRAEDVPAGWTTGAEKAALTKAAPSPPPSPTPSPPPASPAPPGAPAGGEKGDAAELDAHGHPWSADLHAASRSKTTAGLWRMKVGKSRPDPVKGYPKPAQPLDL